VPIQHGPHFLCCVVLISGKLDLAVSNLRHLGQFALEVLFHLAPDGVELHSDFFDFVSVGRPGKLAA